MKVVRPNEKIISAIFQKGMESVILVSPYISPAGLRIILNIFKAHPNELKKLEMWIRLSPEDYANGLTDYQNLLDFLRYTKDKLKANVEVRHCEKLHAKIYMTESQAFVGSSNLTSNGFRSNIEVGIFLNKKEEIALLQKFIGNNRKFFSLISFDEFEEFCKRLPRFGAKPCISEIEKDSSEIDDILEEPPHYKLPGLR